MLLISPQKLFSFSRYLDFFLNFFNKHLQYTYCPIYREVKKNRQRKLEYNLRTQIVEEKLVPDNFLEN